MEVPEIDDSRNVPSDFKPIGEIMEVNWQGRSDLRRFYAYGSMLVILDEYTSYAASKKDPRTGEPGLIFTQIEFPVDTANWVVDRLEPFAREGMLPGTITKQQTEVEGERIALIRGPSISGPEVPGWELVNYDRKRRNSMLDDFQAFPMSDPFLWEQGMFDLWKNIAQRHKQGEF